MDSRWVSASLFNRPPPKGDQRFEVIRIHESYLYHNPLPPQFQTQASGVKRYGIAGAYTICDTPNLLGGTACLLTKVAIATPDCVLVVTLDFEDSPGQIVDHTCLYNNFFPEKENPCIFTGFNLDRLSLQLFGEYGLYICQGIDLLSLGINNITVGRTPKRFLKIYKEEVSASGLMELLYSEEDTPDGDPLLATRAWAGAVMDQISEKLSVAINGAEKIDVTKKQNETIELHRIMLSSDRLRNSAEEFQMHDIEVKRQGAKFFAVSQQFNTRVRASDFEFEITFENEVVNARIKGVRGTEAELILTTPINLKEAGRVVKALTLGRPEANSLEHQKSNIILFALQGRFSLFQNPLLKQIWSPDPPEAIISNVATPELYGEEVKRLNESQTQAVLEMLKKDQQPRVVLIHGPPGTGKTSVICAMAQSLLLSSAANDEAAQKQEKGEQLMTKYEHEEEEDEDDNPPGPFIWIIAHSNVAVKNVAEKLVKIGLLQFKLMVSEEFHFEWHEDLYHGLANTKTTQSFPKNAAEVRSWLGDAQIILSTLSMITSPVLQRVRFHDFAPVHNVVVDEASQIQLGDLLPLIHLFGSEIERICLVGDHKQLAPYGQEQIPGLESIFEKEHIVERAQLLNQTYRLPQPICDIISPLVYDNKLDSDHPECRNTCCKWIDIADGEEKEDYKSFINEREVEACILLATELAERGKEFRIISPYATQTTLIMNTLKELGMQWENICFNVDSFQGNEADYIIISLVRTKSIGFLDNDRRANVLLTRCRKGMFVVCNQRLITSERARRTLLGRFASSWTGNQAWTGGKAGQKWPTFQDLVGDEIKKMIDPDLGPPRGHNQPTHPGEEANSRGSKKARRKATRKSKRDLAS